MLLGNLCDIVLQEGTICTLCFHPEHPIYSAHFPGNPITPGVCFVQVAQELLSMILNQPYVISSVPSFKLLKVHTPDVLINVHLITNGSNLATYTFENEGIVYSILKFEYSLLPNQCSEP